MNYLQLITDFTNKWGLPTLGAVIGSTDATAKQLLALTHETTEYLQQFQWEPQFTTKTFTQKIGEDQGTLVSIFGAGYRALIPNTLWNLTQRRPIYGPRDGAYHQAIVGLKVGGPLYQYRVAGNKLLIIPAPTNATDSLSAVYQSKYTVLASDGTTFKDRVTVDDDTFLYPDNVFKSQLEWRWLKQKGEAWAAARIDASDAISKNINKDDWMPTLNFNTGEYELKPGIWIPAGSWTL